MENQNPVRQSQEYYDAWGIWKWRKCNLNKRNVPYIFLEAFYIVNCFYSIRDRFLHRYYGQEFEILNF